MLGAIAAGGFVNLASSRMFDKEDSSGRFSLSIGTVANANDFAGHLLLVLPFLVWLAITPRTRFIRLLALTGVAYGIYLVLASGSRGATIALAVDLVFFIFAARPRQRVAVLLLGLAFVAAAVTVLPDTVVRRITALSNKDSDAPEEAVESSRSRQMLLEDSISMALHHPFFGVGPGQFAIIEGQSTRRWHPAHNSYTATAAETGLLGFGLLVAGVLATWRMLKRAARNAAGVSLPSDYTAALLCARLAMVGFCTAIFFLNFSYFFYLPAMTGLAIAFNKAQSPATQAE
jgi:O-antigen ligase